MKWVPKEEMQDILYHCHTSNYDGHFRGQWTSIKVLHLGFYWPTLIKDYHTFVMHCGRYQRCGNIFRRQEMPLHGMIEVDLFDGE